MKHSVTGSTTVGDIQPIPSIGTIPGLGTTADQVLRDNLIAYWQAWQRDTQIQTCMRQKGQPWVAEVLYDESTTVELAEFLGIEVSAPTSSATYVSPEEVNMQTFSHLTGKAKDAYALALWGVSAAEMERRIAAEADPDPSTRTSDELKACRGSAWGAAESIWDIRAKLVDLDEIRGQLQDSGEFAAEVRPYSECYAKHGIAGVSSPGDVESGEFQTNNGPTEYSESQLSDARVDCEPLWVTVNSAVTSQAWNELYQRDETSFRAQIKRYTGVDSKVKNDQLFRAFLSERATVALALLGK